MTQRFPGECYERALKHMREDLPSELQDEARLVHGTVRGRQGKRVDHAWVEYGDGVGLVYDGTYDKPFDRAVFYEMCDARAERRYELIEALRLSVKAHHWGPMPCVSSRPP